jgi:hypothetical protein
MEPTLGWGEFICLRVSNLAVPVGSVMQWDASFKAILLPTAGTSKNTGVQVAVSVSTCAVSGGVPTPLFDGTGLPANSTNDMYAWFQITGRAWTLTGAAAKSPSVPIYIAGTAGRVKTVASAGQMILGARSLASTTTSTQSLAVVWFNRSCVECAV